MCAPAEAMDPGLHDAAWSATPQITCFVRGCNDLAVLSDVAVGKVSVYVSHYCSECYEKLWQGADLEIEAERMEVRPLDSRKVPD